VAKAETADEKRFEAHNGLQAQLEAQTSTFVTRNEVNLQLGAVTARMETLAGRMDRTEGGSAGSAETRTEQRQTQAVGISQQALAFMAISVLISVAAVIVALVHR
jgi:hypothetical protein